MNTPAVDTMIAFPTRPPARRLPCHAARDGIAAEHRDPDDERWSQLMAATQRGDKLAYDRLLREIVPFIRAVARCQHASRDRADEVVQDVLLTLHRIRHTFDPTRSFRRWLAVIARRRSIDALRRRCRYRGVEVAAGAVGRAYDAYPDPATHRLEEAQASADHLGKAISGLPPLQREAVELLKLREMSLAEASSLTGRSVEALKVNVHRALKSLQKQMLAS